jgi:hypothetical protein
MNDPLNINIPLEGVDTSLPLLPEQDYQLQCAESSVVPNKRKDGYNWALVFHTTEPLKAIDDRDVKVNFPLYMQIALQPAEDSKDVEGFKRQLGQAVDALFGTSKENRPAFDMALVKSAVGRLVVATTKNEEFPEKSGNKSTKISRLKKSE